MAPAIPPTNLPVANIRLQKSLRTSDVPKNFGTSSPDGRHNTVRSPVEFCLGTRPSQAAKSRPFAKRIAAADCGHHRAGEDRPNPGHAHQAFTADILACKNFDLA